MMASNTYPLRFLFKIASRFLYFPQANKARFERIAYLFLCHFKHWTQIDSISKLWKNNEVKTDCVIWLYWRQGEENAPLLVKKCINSIRQHIAESHYTLILLTKDNLTDYVKMPSHISQLFLAGKIGEAQYSDLIRIYLLSIYGGIWCDATCLMSSSIPEYITSTPFFMFRRCLIGESVATCDCSSWFIKANHGNQITSKAFNFMAEYYKHFNKPIHYYLVHLVITMLTREDNECKSIWNNMPYACNMEPHIFYFEWGKEYTEQRWQYLINTCFIHKLSYKFDNALLSQSPENIIQHLLK